MACRFIESSCIRYDAFLIMIQADTSTRNNGLIPYHVSIAYHFIESSCIHYDAFLIMIQGDTSTAYILSL
jgi:hypothetical protein